jgi:hypothetical protein
MVQRMGDSNRNLQPEDIDRLGQALLTLTRELWVVKDRVRVLEAALAQAGVLGSDAVNQLQPDAALQAELAAERARLIDTVLAALAPERD